VPEDEPHEREPYTIESIATIARSSKKVVAIGETGLDFFRIDEDRDRAVAERLQEDALREHLHLAASLRLPVVIHCRDAFTRLAQMLQEEQGNGVRVPGVIHCFTGSWSEAQPLLDLGLHLSFTGIITFPPKKTDDAAQHVHRVIERMPFDRILVETDAPWLTPIPHRGKRNEPAYVQHVAEQVAALRKIDVESVEKQTTQNAQRLFRIG
jgi:TatD DNase family protein